MHSHKTPTFFPSVTTEKVYFGKERLYVTPCERCMTKYYSPCRNNRKKNGFPNIYVCHSCFEVGISRKERKSARVLNGSRDKPKTSGETFSKSFTSKYPRMPQPGKATTSVSNAVGNAVHTAVDTVSDGATAVAESIQHGANVVVDDFKSVVNVVESGISGLVQGASEALASLPGMSSNKK